MQGTNDPSNSSNTSKKKTQPVTEEINEQVSPLVKKITENLKQIGIVFGIIILLAAAVTGYRYYRVQTLKQGRAELARIMLQADQKQRVADLEDFLPEAPEKLQPSVRLQLAAQAMDSQQFDLAVKYWNEIAKETDNPDLKIIARIGQANALHLQGKTAEGITILTQLGKEAPERYQENINHCLASMAEESGDWQTALLAYEQLKSESGLTSGNTGYLDYKIKQLQQKIAQGKS